MMQYGVATHINTNDYDYDKQIKEKNRDVAQLKAQIQALSGVTGDATNARRAKLQAELKEREEDLEETRFDHLIEVQQQGFEKLSQDMNEALQDAIDLINGNQEALQKTALQMLAQLETNKVDEQAIINGIIGDTGTRIHDDTKLAIDQSLGGTNGIIQQAKSIYDSNQSIGQLIVGTGASGINGWIHNLNTSQIINAENIVSGIAVGTESISEKQQSIYNSLKMDYGTYFESLAATQTNTQTVSDNTSSIKDILSTVSGKIDTLIKGVDFNKFVNSIGDTTNGSIKSIIDSIGGVGSDISKLGTSISGVLGRLEQAEAKAKQEEEARKKAEAEKAAAEAAKKKAEEEKAAADKKLKDQTAAQTVIDAIKNIGTVKANDESNNKIQYAIKAYNALTQDQKNLVTNKKTLDDANAQYTDLVKQKNALQSSISTMQKELSALQSQQTSYSQTAKGYADKRRQLEKELKAAQLDYNNAPKSRKAVLDRIINDLVAQIRSAKTNYEKYRDLANGLTSSITKKNKDITDAQNKLKSYASGSKRINKSQLAWTNENPQSGTELIVRPSDGAILTPLKANDSIIPANLAENLFKWGAINPDSFAINPFMGKWGNTSANNGSDMFSNNTTNQNVDVHFDSLITVQGNVDADVVSRLEDLSKSLTNNKNFQQNVIKFVTKDFVKESRKLGLR